MNTQYAKKMLRCLLEKRNNLLRIFGEDLKDIKGVVFYHDNSGISSILGQEPSSCLFHVVS